MTKGAQTLNSLAPGGFENIFQNVFFTLISWIDTLSNSCETALRSMPQNPSDDKSTLVQVMAWCRQAASHYLSQCCPRSLSPYGVTRPQWVNSSWPSDAICHWKSAWLCCKMEFMSLRKYQISYTWIYRYRDRLLYHDHLINLTSISVIYGVYQKQFQAEQIASIFSLRIYNAWTDGLDPLHMFSVFV